MMGSFVNKRKREAPEPDMKKTKALVGEREKELYELSEEWPVYNHPEGGTVKITPWGSLRQYVDPQSGQNVTKFEDASFSDLSFANAAHNQYYELPSTPMSLNMSSSSRSSPDPEKITFSPNCEAELYVVDGYRSGGLGNGPGAVNGANNVAGHAVGQQQFGQEQEHYFGMMEQEEFSDTTDSMML